MGSDVACHRINPDGLLTLTQKHSLLHLCPDHQRGHTDLKRPGQSCEEHCCRAGISTLYLMYHGSRHTGPLSELSQGPAAELAFYFNPSAQALINFIHHSRQLLALLPCDIKENNGSMSISDLQHKPQWIIDHIFSIC